MKEITLHKGPKSLYIAYFLGIKDNAGFICFDFIENLFGKAPKNIRVKFYNKNPKRKNTFKVNLVGRVFDSGLIRKETGLFINGKWTDSYQNLRRFLDENDLRDCYAIIERV